MGGSVNAKSELGQGTEFIVDMNAKIKLFYKEQSEEDEEEEKIELCNQIRPKSQSDNDLINYGAAFQFEKQQASSPCSSLCQSSMIDQMISRKYNMNFLIANDELFQLECIKSMVQPFNVNQQYSENGVEAFKYI